MTLGDSNYFHFVLHVTRLACSKTLSYVDRISIVFTECELGQNSHETIVEYIDETFPSNNFSCTHAKALVVVLLTIA